MSLWKIKSCVICTLGWNCCCDTVQDKQMIWCYQRDRERHANYLFAVWRPWLPLYIYMDKYVFQFGKKYIMEKIYIYSSGFWWETKQTPITSSRCPIPSQVQSKDTKLPRADNMVSEKKFREKNAIFDLYIDTPFSPFQLEFAFHNKKLFHIISCF